MPDLRPECCPTCAADPKAAPQRYCASKRCRCGHRECPAYASYQPLHPAPLGVTPIAAPERVAQKRQQAAQRAAGAPWRAAR